MFVPIIPNTTIINKTIVYSDTVLPLKDSGENLKVCSIRNVEEYSLESCLRIIFKSNPNVVFNTIQYSKNNKTVYFYTDKEISTRAYYESKSRKYEPLNNTEEIIEEVVEILSSEKVKDEDCISLYDVYQFMKMYYDDYNHLKRKYSDTLSSKLSQEYYEPIFLIHNINYSKNQIETSFRNLFHNYDDITFEKKDGDLYIVKSEASSPNKILELIGKDLSELYDRFKKFEGFKNQSKNRIRTVNSKFLVYIGTYEIDIYNKPYIEKDFELEFPYNDKCKYNCNSTLVINALKGKEEEIFKKIFISIDDCPKWSREELYQIRKRQVEKERLLEEFQARREMKKQKRLELKRKIFPWMN